jgi:flagellar hook-associated protein 3 FlgL
MYQTAVTNFNNMQSNIADTINQVDTGLALNSPADNPAAASQVLVVTQSKNINTQYGVNGQNATNALSTADGVLAGVTNLLQSLKSTVVQAGDGTLNASDRTTIAQQFQTGISQLLNLANSTDGNGNYLFSGSATGSAGYVASPNGAQYVGNQEVQLLQVDASQQTAVTVPGSTIFGNIPVSSNAFFGIANAANTSTATISAGTVSNAASVTGDTYSINFTSPTQYNVLDTSTGATIASNQAYTSGAPITFDGIQISVSNGASPTTGIPAAGDQFSVQPGNQNIFQALTNVISALSGYGTTTADGTNFANSLAQANTSITSALNNVLAGRDQIGNSLQQLTSLQNVSNTTNLSYATSLSSLQDVNYAQAISQLSEEQFTYQAAQKAFAATSQLSLINMLPIA